MLRRVAFQIESHGRHPGEVFDGKWPKGTLKRLASITPVAEASDEYLYVVARAISALEEWGANDNGDGFEWKELLKAYPTFIRGGVYLDHDNEDKSKAIGIIVDAYPNFDEKAIDVLMAISRKKAPEVCKGIEEGVITDVSMGVIVGQAICSICGNVATSEDEYCDHVKHHKAEKIVVEGSGEEKLVYEINRDLTFFEVSIISPDSEGADREAKFRYRLGSVDEKDASFADYIIDYDRTVTWEPAEDGGYIARWKMPVSGSEKSSHFADKEALDYFLHQMELAGFKAKKGMKMAKKKDLQREAYTEEPITGTTPAQKEHITWLDRGSYQDPEEKFQEDYNRTKQETKPADFHGSQVQTQLDRGDYKKAMLSVEEAASQLAEALIREQEKQEQENKKRGAIARVLDALGIHRQAREIPLGPDEGDVTEGRYGPDHPLRGNPMWMKWYGPYGDSHFLFQEQWQESQVKDKESRQDIEQQREIGGFAGSTETLIRQRENLKKASKETERIYRAAEEDVQAAESEAQKLVGLDDWNRSDFLDRMEMTARAFLRRKPEMPLATVVALLSDLRHLSEDQSKELLDRLTALPKQAAKKTAQEADQDVERPMTLEELQDAFLKASSDEEREAIRRKYHELLQKQLQGKKSKAATRATEILSYVKRRAQEGVPYSQIRQEVAQKFSLPSTQPQRTERGPGDTFGGPGASHEVPGGTGQESEFGPYPRRSQSMKRSGILFRCPTCKVAYKPSSISEYADGVVPLCPADRAELEVIRLAQEDEGFDIAPPPPPPVKEKEEEEKEEKEEEEKKEPRKKSPRKKTPKKPAPGAPTSPGEGYAGVTPEEMNEREFPRSSAQKRTAADVGQHNVDITRGTGTLWNPQTIELAEEENQAQQKAFKEELKEARKRELRSRLAAGSYEEFLVAEGEREVLGSLSAEGKTERQKQIEEILQEVKRDKVLRKKLDQLPKAQQERWYKTYSNALYHYWKVKKLPKAKAKQRAAQTAWDRIPKKYLEKPTPAHGPGKRGSLQVFDPYEEFLISEGEFEALGSLSAEGKTERQEQIEELLQEAKEDPVLRKKVDQLPKAQQERWYKTYASALYHYWKVKGQPKAKAKQIAAQTAWDRIPAKYLEKPTPAHGPGKQGELEKQAEGSEYLTPRKPPKEKGTTSADLAEEENANQAKEFAEELKEAKLKVEKNGWIGLSHGDQWSIYNPQKEKVAIVALADVDLDDMKQEYQVASEEEAAEVFNSERYGLDVLNDVLQQVAPESPIATGARIKISQDWEPTGEETPDLLHEITQWRDGEVEGTIVDGPSEDGTVVAVFGSEPQQAVELQPHEFVVVGQSETGTDVNWTDETLEIADEENANQAKEFKQEQARNSFGPDSKIASKEDPEKAQLRARLARLRREKCLRIAEEMARKHILEGMEDVVTAEELESLIQEKADQLMRLDDDGLYELEKTVKSALDPEGQQTRKAALRTPVHPRGQSTQVPEYSLDNPNFFSSD